MAEAWELRPDAPVRAANPHVPARQGIPENYVTPLVPGRGCPAHRGQHVVPARNLLAALRGRELAKTAQKIAADTGLEHRPLAGGQHVAGIYRRHCRAARTGKDIRWYIAEVPMPAGNDKSLMGKSVLSTGRISTTTRAWKCLLVEASD